jgi:hypothetical protein
MSKIKTKSKYNTSGYLGVNAIVNGLKNIGYNVGIAINGKYLRSKTIPIGSANESQINAFILAAKESDRLRNITIKEDCEYKNRYQQIDWDQKINLYQKQYKLAIKPVEYTCDYPDLEDYQGSLIDIDLTKTPLYNGFPGIKVFVYSNFYYGYEVDENLLKSPSYMLSKAANTTEIGIADEVSDSGLFSVTTDIEFQKEQFIKACILAERCSGNPIKDEDYYLGHYKQVDWKNKLRSFYKNEKRKCFGHSDSNYVLPRKIKRRAFGTLVRESGKFIVKENKYETVVTLSCGDRLVICNLIFSSDGLCDVNCVTTKTTKTIINTKKYCVIKMVHTFMIGELYEMQQNKSSLRNG